MKSGPKIERASGITIIELVAIVIGLFLLAAVLLPYLARTGVQSDRIHCDSNLHQIGLSVKSWALDNYGNYPAQRPATNGGAMEFACTGNVARVFEVMSNELNSPKILVCPTDAKRVQASLFNNTLSNLNLSYFIGIDANEFSPAMFLSGDRNITTNSVQLSPGAVHLLRTNTFVGWTSGIHRNNGNVLIVDGSAQQWSNAELRAGLRGSGTTNRIAVP